MKCDDVRDTVEALLVADPDMLSRDEVAVLVRESHRLRSWLDSVDVRCARRTRALAAEGRAEPAESLLGDEGRRSSKEAAAVGERDEVCEAMPGFEEALASGAVSAGHLDAIANATRRVDQDVRDEFCEYERQLLIAAEQQRIEQFERTCRDLARHLAAMHHSQSETDELERQRTAAKIKRWVDKQTGMHHTHVELDPVRDAMFKTAFDAYLRRARKRDGNAGTPWSQLEVDAFMDAVMSGVTHNRSCGDAGKDVGQDVGQGVGDGTANGNTGGKLTPIDETPAHLRVPRISVLLSYDKLVHDAERHGLCETSSGIPLPIHTVRKLCCDAEIVPIVMNGKGQVLDVGRSSRTVTAVQREALRAMHRTCGNSECAVPFDACHIHHVKHWTAHHGPTNIDNLLPLCDRHHHLVHEGGWTLTMTPERVATWTRPDGMVHQTAGTIDRIAESSEAA